MATLTEITSIAAPILLAVMGLFVSVSPPRPGSNWRYLWIACFVILGAAAFMANYQQQKMSDTAQESLRRDLRSIKKSIAELTKPIPNKSEPSRDPDAIYQNGVAVGRVIAPRITLNESKVYFEKLENAGNLDRSKPFEYRDLVLRMTGATSYIGMLVTTPGVTTGVYQNVVCDIVGRE